MMVSTSGALASLLPRIAAVLTIAIGLCALAGWIFGVSALKTVVPQEAPIEASSSPADASPRA